MNEEMLLKPMNLIRNRTIALLDATTEELADEIPNGFRNNLRWNFGHIVVSQENLLCYFLGEENCLQPEVVELFKGGTSPESWEEKVPTLLEIKSLLEEQYERVIKRCTGKLSFEGENPLVLGPEYEFKTLGEVIGFTNFHESLHQGNIMSLKRALGVDDLWQVTN